MNDLPNLGPGSNSIAGPQNIEELHEIRLSAWRSIVLATASCAAVAVVYIFSKSLVWTGGLLLAAGWIWKSFLELRVANQEIISEEKRTGLALMQPLPSWINVSLVLGIPLTLVLGASALNTYDPYLFGGSSSSSGGSSSSSGGSSSSQADDLTPSVIETVELTDEELEYSTFEWSVGVNVWVPEVCNKLTVYWHSEDDFGNVFEEYYNWYDDLLLGQVNELFMGTDDSISEEETSFLADRAECN